MKTCFLLSATVAFLGVSFIDDAYAQRGGGFRGGGGGFRGAAIGGAGFRGGVVGGGFRGAAIGGGYRGMPMRAGYGGYGYRGARIGLAGPGYGYRGARIGWVGPRYNRHVAWAGPGHYPYYRYGYRRWGWPLAAGIALGAVYAYDSCWRYDGWQWVNVCYRPYGYGYSSYY